MESKVFKFSTIVVSAIIAVVVSLMIRNNSLNLKADVSSYNKFSLDNDAEFVNLTYKSYRIKLKVNGSKKNVEKYTYYVPENSYSKTTTSSSLLLNKVASNIIVTANGNGQEVQKTYKFDPVKEYISQLYRGFRGSNPDTSGLNYWIGIYNNGDINSVIKQLYLSREAESNLNTNTKFVTAMYKGILGRNPDDSGLKFWVNKLDSGTSRDAILNSFFSTNEFKRLVSFYNLKNISVVNVKSLNVSVPKKTLTIGETVQVISTVLPENATNKELKYSSSNASVATVDANGNITAVGTGSAKILVTSAQNTKIRKQISIIVKSVTVKSLNVSVPKKTLTIGETVQVISTVLPENATNKELKYSSSNKSVATVDVNGNIKGISEGKTTITVTSVQNSKIKKQISIVVKKSNVSVNISKDDVFTKTKIVTLKNTSGNKKAITYYQIDTTDDDKWVEYTKPFKVNKNCTIYIKNSDIIYIREITKIDSESPILSDDVTVKKLRSSSYSIMIKVNDEDSGLSRYTYTIGSKKVTKKFKKNKKGQTITLKIKETSPSKYIKLTVKDNAGNSITKKYTINSLNEYILQLYNGMRGNSPDKEGLEYWKKQYSSNNLSMNGIIRNIYLSSEANQRLNTNSKFVEGMYSGIFGRTPSDKDKKYWVNRLDKGMSRKDFINTILKTDEYKKLVKLYQFSTKLEYNPSVYTANEVYTCPDGWTSNGKGTCTRVTQYECGTYVCGKQLETYDCKTPKYQWATSTYEFVDGVQHYKGQCFGGTKTEGDYQYRNCYCKRSLSSVETVCEMYKINRKVNTEYSDGKCSRWVDKTCTKVCDRNENTTAPKSYSCSNDAVLKGDSCYYCPKGGTYNQDTNKCIIE